MVDVAELPMVSVIFLGFPDDSAGRELACNAGDTGDMGLIPGLGRYSGEGNCCPLQYSCLKNPMNRGFWGATVQWVSRSQTWQSN